MALTLTKDRRAALLHHWRRAVERSKGWAEGNEE